MAVDIDPYLRGLEKRYNLFWLSGESYFDEWTASRNYFRDYDPAIGRYVESDQNGLSGGTNATYNYARSNSVICVDSLRLFTSDQHAAISFEALNSLAIFDPTGSREDGSILTTSVPETFVGKLST